MIFGMFTFFSDNNILFLYVGFNFSYVHPTSSRTFQCISQLTLSTPGLSQQSKYGNIMTMLSEERQNMYSKILWQIFWIEYNLLSCMVLTLIYTIIGIMKALYVTHRYYTHNILQSAADKCIPNISYLPCKTMNIANHNG